MPSWFSRRAFFFKTFKQEQMKARFSIILLLSIFLASTSTVITQETLEIGVLNQNLVVIDLNNTTDDHKLFVKLYAPDIEEETVEFHFPKIVPGTYTIYNFGRFITDLKAYDKDDNILSSKQLDTNKWLIDNAKNLDRVTYWVRDTYHSNDKPIVFEPVGSCFDKGRVFVLNNFCYVGYFNGYKELPFTLSVTKPEGFYGATSLPLKYSRETEDVYHAKNYFELHDNPILYSLPDTASVMVNNTRVLLSLYSPNLVVSANYLISHTEKLFEAQGKYLGGVLPADRYTILLYMFTGNSKSGNAGALEHFQSTVMSYPETADSIFVEPFQDIISHEFFHIVTPLSIHSKEIGNFDFTNPAMSKHLWLYEGSTEYYAHHSQVKHGVTTPDEFFIKMGQKIMISSNYYNDTLPFTVLSLRTLDEQKSQYGNVYQKGALISMCLDLELLKLSGGKFGLQNLKSALVERYGPDKTFDDEELFDVITQMTFPEIRGFFKKYVEGPERLPYGMFLGYAGYEYYEKLEREVPALIGASIFLNHTGQFEVENVYEFGKKLKLKSGDILQSINGTVINPSNFSSFSRSFTKSAKPGDVVSITVLRSNSEGKLVDKTLKTKTYIVKIKEKNVILPADKPTEEQMKIRKAWLNQ